MRVNAAHTWPEWPIPPKTMSGSTSSSAMSSAMIAADLPPSSSVTRAIRSPHRLMIRRPAAVLPVNATLSTSGCETRCSPTSRPVGRMLTTPSGSPAASIASASSITLTGPSGAGFRMTVQPAASAGPSFSDAVATGPFHGMIVATTPTGSRTIRALPSAHVRVSSNAKRSCSVAASAHIANAFSWNARLTASGAPISAVNEATMSSKRCSTSWRMRRSAAARSAASMRGHGPSSNARRAAATAASTSAGCASGTVAITSSVTGDMTSITLSLDGATQRPPMNSCE